MSERPIVDIPVIGVEIVALPANGQGDVLIALRTEADADVRLKLTPQALVDLEAMLARAGLEQAKLVMKQ